MSKLKEIWQIIKRKEPQEVHSIPIPGGYMISNQLYKKLELETDEKIDTKFMGDLYGVKVITTSQLPYIKKKMKKVKL